MEKITLIFWTAKDLKEAKEIARDLLKKKLVACVNVIPQVHSLYLWEGKIEESAEVKVYLKTKDSLFIQVKEYIVEHASYEVPEILKVSVEEVHIPYQCYVLNSLQD